MIGATAPFLLRSLADLRRGYLPADGADPASRSASPRRRHPHPHVAKAADAANRAVMSDTDEASASAAREAEEATRAVERDLQQLQPMLKSLGYSGERHVRTSFNRSPEHRKLDEMLPLATENTNLKAQHLSFGPAPKPPMRSGNIWLPHGRPRRKTRAAPTRSSPGPEPPCSRSRCYMHRTIAEADAAMTPPWKSAWRQLDARLSRRSMN